MTSAFDFIENADYHQGNPRHLSCHGGLVYVLEETHGRPRTVVLKNIDNLSGEDPDPELVSFEDLPRGLRRELRKRNIRFRSTGRTSVTAAEVM